MTGKFSLPLTNGDYIRGWMGISKSKREINKLATCRHPYLFPQKSLEIQGSREIVQQLERDVRSREDFFFSRGIRDWVNVDRNNRLKRDRLQTQEKKGITIGIKFFKN